MKSLVIDKNLEIMQAIYFDAGMKCSTECLDDRDLITIRSRFKHEGMSFFTLTLPKLGSELELALERGYIRADAFRNFRKRFKIPAFMQGFFSQVFDVVSGEVREDANPTSIESIRQVAYAFKKIDLACSDEKTAQAIRDYRTCELELSFEPRPELTTQFCAVSSMLWNDVLVGKLKPLYDTKPKHGPGATAEGITSNKKYIPKRWHKRLDPWFPMLHNAFHAESACESREFRDLVEVEEQNEQPVRVITVPKTLKAPRIIAIEPVCMQYAQQAVSRELVRVLEKDRTTGGHINFSDQQINRDLAIRSSKTMRMATLDLSAASDRVPLSLALRMFDAVPDYQGAIRACRSKTAELPSGQVIGLKKFASMGSALCFPIEAMYFYTLCVMAQLEKHYLPVDIVSIRKVAKDIYVYGDDIVVPTDTVDCTIAMMQKYYCKINTNKSFWIGKFRESCGMDAYDGVEVTPTYIRRDPNCTQTNQTVVSLVSTSNLFYKRGYWRTAQIILNICEDFLGHKLPLVAETCSGLGKVSYQKYVSSGRWSRKLQRNEVKMSIPYAPLKRDRLTGYGALLKFFLNPTDIYDVRRVDHLTRSEQRGAVALKRRWIAPY